jgi:hypothetical protein
MATAPQNTTPARDWRFPLSIGLAIGVALPTTRGVQSALEPGLGFGAAFAISLVAAGLVGAIAALAIAGLFRLAGRGPSREAPSPPPVGMPTARGSGCEGGK